MVEVIAGIEAVATVVDIIEKAFSYPARIPLNYQVYQVANMEAHNEQRSPHLRALP